jgi:hypothetical protein
LCDIAILLWQNLFILVPLTFVRKITAILLMLVLVFNFYGYRIVISLLQNKADQKLETRIDNKDYNESQLIELRVSLNMPYQERYTEFERHYGEINIDGKLYTYVKRKIEGDVLVLKCIANESKQQLKQTANDLTKSNSGQDQENNSKKHIASFKPFASDFDDTNQFCHLSINNIYNSTLAPCYSALLKDVLIKTPHQPPKAILHFS